MHLDDKEWNDLGVYVGRSTPIMISALGRCDDETQCGQDRGEMLHATLYPDMYVRCILWIYHVSVC